MARTYEELQELTAELAYRLVKADANLKEADSNWREWATRCLLLEDKLKEVTETDVRGMQTDALRGWVPQCAGSKA